MTMFSFFSLTRLSRFAEQPVDDQGDEKDLHRQEGDVSQQVDEYVMGVAEQKKCSPYNPTVNRTRTASKRTCRANSS